MSSSRTLSRKRRTSFTCIKPRFGPSIILLYIAASVEQYCDITQVNALPENEGILEGLDDRSGPPSWEDMGDLATLVRASGRGGKQPPDEAARCLALPVAAVLLGLPNGISG